MKYQALRPLYLVVFAIRKIVGLIETGYHRERMRANAKRCGEGLRINGSGTVTGLTDIELGGNIHIGKGFHIRGEGGLSIGDNAHISRNVTIYTINHQYEGKRLPYDETFRFNPVVIGKNVWIGMNVTILPGAIIGDGAIIGAGTVLHGVVPDHAIMGSPGCILIKYRDSEHYDRLEKAGSYGGINGEPLDGD